MVTESTLTSSSSNTQDMSSRVNNSSRSTKPQRTHFSTAIKERARWHHSQHPHRIKMTLLQTHLHRQRVRTTDLVSSTKSHRQHDRHRGASTRLQIPRHRQPVRTMDSSNSTKRPLSQERANFSRILLRRHRVRTTDLDNSTKRLQSLDPMISSRILLRRHRVRTMDLAISTTNTCQHLPQYLLILLQALLSRSAAQTMD